MRILFRVLLALLLTGCATQPVKIADSQPVSERAVLALKYLTSNDSRHMPVTIVRDQGWMGSLVTAVLILNGEAVALLDPEQSITLYLEPKTYMVAIEQETNYLGEPTDESELVISTELPNTFRLRMISGEGARLDRSSLL